MNGTRRTTRPKSNRRPLRGKDRLSAARRSWNMSRIRGKHTTPERRVRSLLHRLGYRFRLHVRISVDSPQKRRDAEKTVLETRRGVEFSLSASTGERCRMPRFICPDLILPKHRLAIFVHGCFWHRHKGCKNCTTPTARRDWWLAKLNGNAVRDQLHQRALRKLGWRTLVVWECETEKAEQLGRIQRKFTQLLDRVSAPLPRPHV